VQFRRLNSEGTHANPQAVAGMGHGHVELTAVEVAALAVWLRGRLRARVEQGGLDSGEQHLLELEAFGALDRATLTASTGRPSYRSRSMAGLPAATSASFVFATCQFAVASTPTSPQEVPNRRMTSRTRATSAASWSGHER
jgi:hypothetical protein